MLHLLPVHIFQGPGDEGVQGYGKKHDGQSNKRRPAKEIIKRNKRKDKLNADVEVKNQVQLDEGMSRTW